jgi:tetratricopeptide (TPR) repeat protein
MPSANPPPDAPLKTHLAKAVDTLQADPATALKMAEQLISAHPDSDAAAKILAVAHRLLGNPEKALGILEPMLERTTRTADLLHEAGLCLGAAGRGAEAIAILREAVAADTNHAGAWRTLGDQLSVAGESAAAEEAFEKHLALSTRHPELIDAATFLRNGNLAKAEQLTRDVLKKDPVDVVAIRMLASIGIKLGQIEDACNLLERCLQLAPGFHLARHGYAVALFRRNELDQALEQVDKLLLAEPNNPNYLILKGTLLVRKGDHQPALELYERILKDYPEQSAAQMNYGHTLKSVGRLEEGVQAYRRSIALSPSAGEAYWSLANLKTVRFTDDDIRDMRAQIKEDGDPEEQSHLAFSLGKAFEDRKQYDESFYYYDLGNSIRGKHHRYSAKINVVNTARQIKTLTPEFFAERSGWGSPAKDPIFIVGLPRAGSTLLEQILASHSQVEGTAELPDIIAISRKLGQKSRKNPASYYPEILAKLSRDEVQKLGDGYIESTAMQRHGTPFFIDKMPNNFQHIGMIHLLLPNAKIIDARRHPMAGCFSCYKQLFARGQTFTYNLTDLGRYYRDYVSLMDHWDAVLPGRVHRVQYEDMVADSETEIRRLLDYCGLKFEEQCLRFYETERAVRTPSSEQVRKPIYKEGLEQWRHFEAHLGPLKAALGPVLERYPID